MTKHHHIDHNALAGIAVSGAAVVGIAICCCICACRRRRRGRLPRQGDVEVGGRGGELARGRQVDAEVPPPPVPARGQLDADGVPLPPPPVPASPPAPAPGEAEAERVSRELARSTEPERRSMSAPPQLERVPPSPARTVKRPIDLVFDDEGQGRWTRGSTPQMEIDSD